MRLSVAKLIPITITKDSLRQEIENEGTPNEIVVRVGSITRQEWAQAGQLGVNPQIKLITPRYNYNDENIVEFEGKRYKVYRTYIDSDNIELYLEREAGHGHKTS